MTYQKTLKPTADGSIISLLKQEKDKEELAAYSIILAKSPIFKKMLFGDFSKPTDKDFTFLNKYSVESIQAVIQYLYLDPNWFPDFYRVQQEEKIIHQLTELIVLADYLQLADLVKNGEEILVSILIHLKEEDPTLDLTSLQDFYNDCPSLTKLKAFLEKK